MKSNSSTFISIINSSYETCYQFLENMLKIFINTLLDLSNLQLRITFESTKVPQPTALIEIAQEAKSSYTIPTLIILAITFLIASLCFYVLKDIFDNEDGDQDFPRILFYDWDLSNDLEEIYEIEDNRPKINHEFSSLNSSESSF